MDDWPTVYQISSHSKALYMISVILADTIWIMEGGTSLEDSVPLFSFELLSAKLEL